MGPCPRAWHAFVSPVPGSSISRDMSIMIIMIKFGTLSSVVLDIHIAMYSINVVFSFGGAKIGCCNGYVLMTILLYYCIRCNVFLLMGVILCLFLY